MDLISKVIPALSRRRGIQLLFLFAFVLIVYVRTMAPTVFGLDSAELSLGAMKLGIVHSPGYPVYLLIAHIFTKIPLGDIGFRVNLFSVISGAALVTSLAAALELIITDRKIACGAALAFGFIYYQWTVSLAAEVYAFQGLIFVWILILAIQWWERRQVVHVLLGVFLCSLAAANNPVTILWWPGLLCILGARGGLSRVRRVLPGAFFIFILGLLPVLYLPLRSAANPGLVYVGEYDLQGVFHPLDLTKGDNLAWYLSGGQFGWLFPSLDPHLWLEQGSAVLQQVWSAFLGVGVPLGIWGAWRLRRIDSQLLLCLCLVAFPFLVFFTGYQAPDKEFMLLPFYILWTFLLGLGLEGFSQTFGSRTSWLSWALALVLLLVNYRYVDASNTRMLSEIGEARLTSVEQGAFYLATWGEASIMQYLQEVENVRKDVRVINVFFVADVDLPKLVKEALNKHHNVYLTRRDIFSEPFGLLNPVGHGYQVLLREY